jgi:hypothetical protein
VLACRAFLRAHLDVVPVSRVGRRRERRRASRLPEMYPRCSRALHGQATRNAYLQAFRGSPLTDSNRRPLLTICGRRNQSQPGATDLACFSGFGVRPICRWLPLVAPAGLHKRSILAVRLHDAKTASAASCVRRTKLARFVMERVSVQRCFGCLYGRSRAIWTLRKAA